MQLNTVIKGRKLSQMVNSYPMRMIDANMTVNVTERESKKPLGQVELNELESLKGYDLIERTEIFQELPQVISKNKDDARRSEIGAQNQQSNLNQRFFSLRRQRIKLNEHRAMQSNCDRTIQPSRNHL